MLQATLLATPATSQTTTGSGTTVTTSSTGQMYVDNNQVNNTDTLADVQLPIEQNDGLTKGTAEATGNSLAGGNKDVSATLYSYQFLKGRVAANVTVTGIDNGNDDTSIGTPVYLRTYATGNTGYSVAETGDLNSATSQISNGSDVSATTTISAPNHAIYTSGDAAAASEVNHMAYQITQGSLTSTATQTSTTQSNAIVTSDINYSPSPNAYTATAANNYYGSYSDDQGSQTHDVTQTASAQTLARSTLTANNLWDAATSATAVANNTNIGNSGGALIIANSQTQSGPVQAEASIDAGQYGIAQSSATAVGNVLSAGNNDIYLKLNNNQLSSGGVDAQATFTGGSGYDGYVTAEATGNQALAYTCAECRADMTVNSSQVNNSDVTATATGTVGQGRSIVATARATGNTATYYVSGSSH